MAKWKAKKSNMDRRVNTYSIPGVQEIIYSDEWKRNKQHKVSSRYLYVIGIIIIVIVLYVYLMK